MTRAFVASGTIHVMLLCLAHFGVGPTVSWLGGLLSMGWEFLLALIVAIIAFIAWLIFGPAVIAGMGAATAVVAVIAAVVALGLMDNAAADNATEKLNPSAKESPLDVAVVADPAFPTVAPTRDPKDDETAVPAAPESSKARSARFSPSFGKSEGEGIQKSGTTVKGKEWTVTLPSVRATAADRKAEDALTRRQAKAGDKGRAEKPAEPAATIARLLSDEAERREAQTPRAAQPAAKDADAEDRPAQDRTRAREESEATGVKGVFDRLAKSMPRLAARPAPRGSISDATQAVTQRSKKPVEGRNDDGRPEAVAMIVGKRAENDGEADNDRDLARLRARAEEGYAHAQFALAERILDRTADEARARRLLERAAVGGYVPAQVLLARLEADGTAERPADLAKAHAWLAAAARERNPALVRARDELAKELKGKDAVRALVEAARLKSVIAKVEPAAGEQGKALNEQLRNAAVLGDSEAVAVLLARNADADDADEDGRTPLIEAAWRGYPGIVDALVRAGAKLDARDNSGKGAVAWAAINGHAEVIGKLAAAGCPIDVPDADGFTPLMRAAWNGHADAVAALVAGGANPTARNRFGRSAVDYAREQKNIRIITALSGGRSR